MIQPQRARRFSQRDAEEKLTSSSSAKTSASSAVKFGSPYFFKISRLIQRRVIRLGLMKIIGFIQVLLATVLVMSDRVPQEKPRPRAREAGVIVGVLQPGPLNAITDVGGVSVGNTTLILGDNVRTGVTAILPHNGNLF